MTQGLNYQFKVETRNAYGFSVYSNVVSILTAQVPAQPTVPTTVWSPDNVIVSWTAPDNGGSPIIGYTVTIRMSDLTTYSVEPTYCDRMASLITSCTIPVSTLRASPFLLPWGSSVYAKVVATNSYGNSLVSDENNGAVITTNPDAPISLTEDSTLRTKTTLGLTWSPAAFTGGATIIDY